MGSDQAPAGADRADGEGTGVAHIAVAPDEAGLRLDRWFRRHYPQLAHGRLERWLRLGHVRVDGGRARAGDRLAAGQVIRVPPIAPPCAAPSRPPPSPDERRALAGWVLHQDDHVIVIDKPAGLAVQGGSGVGRNLDAMLDTFGGEGDRPRLVHRLDKDTSGILVLARTPAVAAMLAAAFRSRAVRKLYWAMVVGAPAADHGRITAPIAKRPGEGVERVVVDTAAGDHAITEYRVCERAGRRAAWLALEPQTGRTHQLRVHCLALGTPILGDGKYGGRDAFLAEIGDATRLHLHSRAIAFPHPAGGICRIVAPLPAHLRASWALFGFREESTRETLAHWPDDGDGAAPVRRPAAPGRRRGAGSIAAPRALRHRKGK